MEATVGGSLETGRDEEKNLKKLRPRFIRIQETGARLEQAKEKDMARIFHKKIRSYEEEKSKGENQQLDNIPELREKWDKMCEWIIVLMGYIDEMVCWEIRAIGTSRMKNIIHEAAGIGERDGEENLAIIVKGSGED